MNHNSDDPTNIFNTGGLDPFGPYSRQEDKVMDVNGLKVVTREIHVEQVSSDGTRQVFISHQYLCQGCGSVYVTIGQTGLLVDNSTILCQPCAFRARLMRLLRPLWSPFVKINGQ
jgi:hypothetical protein